MAILLLAGIAGSGCAGEGPSSSGAGSGTFDVMQREIFDKNCLNAGCHTSDARAGSLVLERGLSYGELVNVAPFNVPARDEGLLRAVPNDPEKSLLLIKLVNPPSRYGTRMPQGNIPPLSEADVALVRAWIDDGAPGPSGPEFTHTETPTITDTPSLTPTETPTASPSLTPTPTQTPTVTISPTGTLQPSPTAMNTGTRTPTGTATPTASATSKPTILAGSRFSEIQQNIFNPSCLNLGCHNFDDQAGGQVLDAEHAYDQLVGATPMNPNAISRGFLRVKPGDPTKSFLFIKLTLPTAFDATFSARMPQATPPLPSQQIEQIRAWILRGALRDE